MSKGGILTKKITDHLVSNYDAYVVNVVTASKRGVPDLVVCIAGMFYGFEIKTENDRERDIQTANLDMIAEAEGCGGYVRSIADVDNIIINKIKPRRDKNKARMSL